jgi:hypothetical protein
MHARHLLLALRAGDRSQVVRAASLEIGQLASYGGAVGKREQAVLAIGGTLIERGGDTEGETFLRGAHAIGMFLRGFWRDAARVLDTAYAKYPNHRAGWHANAKLFSVYALYYLGELRALARRATELLVEAEQRNDLYIIVNLRTTSMVDIALAADDPGAARTHIREAMNQWSQSGFLVQHWKAMVWGAEIELYVGDGLRACAILDREERALKRSFLMKVQFLRGMTRFVRARALIASIENTPVRRPERIAAARRIGRQLAREGMPWTDALASMVAAAVQNAAGQRAAAAASLENAIHRAVIADMPLFAWAGRHRLGLLLGGAEGVRRAREAEEAIRAQGVVVPMRYAAMFLPGRWDAEPRAKAK